MVDLNSLIPPNSSLQLTFAVAINARGEIAGFGVPAGCAPQDVGICGHAYVLVPCDQKQSDRQGCEDRRIGDSDNAFCLPFFIASGVSVASQFRFRASQTGTLP
jgi:hypothetical protein